MPVTSIVGLALVIVPALAYLAGALEKGEMTTFMLLGTGIWFATVPLWMGRSTPSRSAHEPTE